MEFCTENKFADLVICKGNAHAYQYNNFSKIFVYCDGPIASENFCGTLVKNLYFPRDCCADMNACNVSLHGTICQVLS